MVYVGPRYEIKSNKIVREQNKKWNYIIFIRKNYKNVSRYNRQYLYEIKM